MNYKELEKSILGDLAWLALIFRRNVKQKVPLDGIEERREFVSPSTPD